MARSEQRKHKRVHFEETVLVNEEVPARAASISEGGMFLYTGQPFQPQNEVAVVFAVQREVLKMQGIVRHFQSDVGIGLMFLNPTEEQRALLADFVQTAALTQPDSSVV